MATTTITQQTKRQSYKEVKKTIAPRQELVLNKLRRFKEGCTASELAMDMFVKGQIPSPDRNYVHPRLNELVAMEYVEIVGKRTCLITGKTVAIYKVKEIANG